MDLVYEYLRLCEKKEHLIQKLDNLSKEEKDNIIKLFQEKPHLENRIDWNNKDLEIKDFYSIMSHVSKTNASKLQNMTIPSNFEENIDYFNLYKDDNFKAIVSLNHKFQKFIQNGGFDGISCKWCIGGNDSGFWTDYTKHSCFIILISKNAKIAVQIKLGTKITFWNSQDANSDDPINWNKSTDYEKLLAESFLSKKDFLLNKIISKFKEIYAEENVFEFTEVSDGTTTIKLKHFRVFGLELYSSLDFEELEIPKYSPENKLVTEIGERGFDGCTNLKKITIPSSISYVEDYAFRDCTNLQIVYTNKTKDAEIENWNKQTNGELFKAEWKHSSLIESFLTNYLR